MDLKTSQDNQPAPRARITRSANVITPQILILFGVIFVAIAAALMMLRLTPKFQMALILAFPSAVVGLYILLNPFAGVFLYEFYEFLRPYDFIPALRPLRLALVIEVVTLLSWIIVLVRTKRPIKWDTMNWMYLLFIGSLAFGTYLALNNFYAYNIFQLMLVGFVMYVIATNAIDSVPRLEKMIWLLVLIHVFFAFRGVMNYVFSPGSSAGMSTSGAVGGSFLADENDFAMAINTFIPIVFFMFMYYKKRWTKLICLGILVLFVAAVVASFSRGGWVGMMVAVAYCIWFSGRRLIGFFWAALAAMVFVAVAPSQYMGEIETISNTKEATADARLKMWAAGFRMFLDYPLVGVGPANGGVHMPEYVRGIRNPDTKWGRTFHGLWAQLFAETGGIGVLLYLSMLFYVLTFLNRIRKRKRQHPAQAKMSYWAAGFFGAIITYLATATFLSAVYYPQIWTIYVLAISMLWIQRDIDWAQIQHRRSLAAAEQATIEHKVGQE
jgi:probable O-glycosylation ligase (exosortase A-associated)